MGKPPAKVGEPDPFFKNLSPTIDPFAMATGLMALGENFQRMAITCAHEMIAKTEEDAPPDPMDPWNAAKAFMEAGLKLAEDPNPLFQASHAYLKRYTALCKSAYQTLSDPKKDKGLDEVIPTPRADRRFSDPAWSEVPGFDFMKQSYLLWDQWLQDIISNIEGLDPKVAHKVSFFTRQLSNTMAPTNFAWANPEVIKRIAETNGLSLIQGISNFYKDLEEGDGRLQISMVERDFFHIGKNIATTKGKVVYENEILQLIQYEPITEKVRQIPILLVPPCINKFYIFDLRPESSFVRWLLNQGWTVFVVSWVNPKDERLAHKTFEDYVIEGIGGAVEAARRIVGEPQINALGFCIGGNFLTTYSGYRAGDKDNPLKSTTYLATLFDFEDAGDLKIFIDEEQLGKMERAIRHHGYFDGRILSRTFNLLRSNDLIWSFVINNYLMGKEAMAFDLLYWNSDYTNLPAAMYLYYLRNMFLENKLIKPAGISIKGRPIDLSKVKVPSFILNTKEDHIAPWPCGYEGAKIFGGPTRFVLGGSGHVAGIFNHPDKNKYGYWTGDIDPKGTESWLTKAAQHSGSWWVEWVKWLEDHGGPMIPARKLGSGQFPPIEDAPGRYVK
ncbi:MAG: class I poly(R)-hydroxyalkanoic acid synthase [Alphaproteobacteria bacterium]|nr:class I poly(R)-hydroxyalkanoic acid synthase [Alphaproteobacteria bacterium]